MALSMLSEQPVFRNLSKQSVHIKLIKLTNSMKSIQPMKVIQLIKLIELIRLVELLGLAGGAYQSTGSITV